ncbi:hypothetical protein IO99_13690 [Clostridium sulfidigenes]|uniref:Uncharacterized protein n=1 Tax=Clostridium sulfidigenes TaxID=318464 RepID=A0A084J9B1_9CLOT|nr:hypothetical protein [Clostridium sulfidigenes]KEZ85545.1 hypothetical protein IO99_13690 [Clostridium sulfidigenes]
MGWDVDLAKEFKKRTNSTPYGPVIGKVIGVNPLRISIFDGKVIISKMYVCSRISVEIDDNVLCIPTADEQKYFIVDKVV